jgi:hypothetical protein
MDISNEPVLVLGQPPTHPGNALSVPAPSNWLDECLSAFERFLHDPTPWDGAWALSERWHSDRPTQCQQTRT